MKREVNIIDVVKPLTKFAACISNPLHVKKILQQALYQAQNGRPGPVWIDVPMNVQGALVNENELEEFVPKVIEKNSSDFKIDEIITELKKAAKNKIS